MKILKLSALKRKINNKLSSFMFEFRNIKSSAEDNYKTVSLMS